jgi:hypothetical protein
VALRDGLPGPDPGDDHQQAGDVEDGRQAERAADLLEAGQAERRQKSGGRFS